MVGGVVPGLPLRPRPCRRRIIAVGVPLQRRRARRHRRGRTGHPAAPSPSPSSWVGAVAAPSRGGGGWWWVVVPLRPRPRRRRGGWRQRCHWAQPLLPSTPTSTPGVVFPVRSARARTHLVERRVQIGAVTYAVMFRVC